MQFSKDTFHVSGKCKQFFVICPFQLIATTGKRGEKKEKRALFKISCSQLTQQRKNGAKCVFLIYKACHCSI